MQKHNPSESNLQKQVQQALSDIQQNQDCITFISLSHYQMHKLIHQSDHFITKVISINRQAKRQIDLGAYKEALGVLSEGQKILEYAAGSGKTIERDLIICVLHNIATAYHKSWIIEKCIRYIEGVIFNMESHLHSLQNSVASSNLNQEIQLALQGLQMKKMLASYCLRFCALNSQQQNHKEALGSSKKAIGYIRNLLTFDESHTRSLFRQQNQPQTLIDLKHRLLLEILQYENSLNVKKQKQALKAAHFSLQIWNKLKQKANSNQYKFLKTYSIGDYMQLKPKDYYLKSQKISSIQQKQKDFQSSIIYQMLMLSISFFSTSTELRLSLAQVQYYSQFQKENSIQFAQAQIYHLLAIIIVTVFIPYDILYLKHIINSYSTSFNSGLVDYKTVEPESYQKIIELLSDNKFKSPNPGSTQIISSEECLPDIENNDYRLKDRFRQNLKKQKKVIKSRRRPDHSQNKKNSNSKNFSSLQTKSIIKEQKFGSRTKTKFDSKLKQKTKSKNKSKSKTLQKRSKDKQKYYFVKTSTSKTKRKHFDQQQGSLSKKVSPKKIKEHPFSKQIAQSEIHHRQGRRHILNHRIHSIKKIINEHKSPKRRGNIYGLGY